MTKIKAVMMILEIVNECLNNEQNGQCRDCVFGNKNTCLVSGGNDIPTQWEINDKMRDLLKES